METRTKWQIAEYARYFDCPPDRLGPEHVREYTAHLFKVRQLSSSAVNQQVAALRFFYVKTIRQPWSVEDTPYAKKEKTLPVVLSVEEVDRLIDAADTLYHRTLLMTAGWQRSTRSSSACRLRSLAAGLPRAAPSLDALELLVRAGRRRIDLPVGDVAALLESTQRLQMSPHQRPADRDRGRLIGATLRLVELAKSANPLRSAVALSRGGCCPSLLRCS